MKLRDLHILMAVAQAGSMNKAAVVLNMTQPAVSRSIAELERALGVSLLDRNAQGVSPTAYGRALLDGGTAVFDDLHQAVKNIEFLADPAAGEVRIGSGTLTPRPLFLPSSRGSLSIIRESSFMSSRTRNRAFCTLS
jgi:DNA-binding transcriptional LysR family regulator